MPYFSAQKNITIYVLFAMERSQKYSLLSLDNDIEIEIKNKSV